MGDGKVVCQVGTVLERSFGVWISLGMGNDVERRWWRNSVVTRKKRRIRRGVDVEEKGEREKER